MGRVAEVTGLVRDYDRCLYAMEMPNGRLDIYRQNREKTAPPHFLFSLTDDWTPQGRPVEWGAEPLMNRIRAHDLWRDDTFVERWIAEEEKRVESRERDRKNSIESFLYDFRSRFHKTFNDVNTSNMEKVRPKGQ